MSFAKSKQRYAKERVCRECVEHVFRICWLSSAPQDRFIKVDHLARGGRCGSQRTRSRVGIEDLGEHLNIEICKFFRCKGKEFELVTIGSEQQLNALRRTL